MTLDKCQAIKPKGIACVQKINSTCVVRLRPEPDILTATAFLLTSDFAEVVVIVFLLALITPFYDQGRGPAYQSRRDCMCAEDQCSTVYTNPAGVE